MNINTKELIEQLKLEIQVIERGGYSPSVHQPHAELRIFRDSVSCPNLALDEKTAPCAHCWLAQFIPSEYLDKEEPCHYLPLNERGDTVASLAERGDEDSIQRELLGWLRRTVKQLEQTVAHPAAT